MAEWFHRASTAVHAGTTGTGLGLALARELLRLHGGDLFVTSRTAKEDAGAHGSTFIAKIPLGSKEGADDGQTAIPFGQYGDAVAKEAASWIRDNRERVDRSDEASSEGGKGSDTQDGSNSAGSSSKLGEGLTFEKEDVLMVVDDSIDMRDLHPKDIFAILHRRRGRYRG